jgi:hypothetical protein
VGSSFIMESGILEWRLPTLRECTSAFCSSIVTWATCDLYPHASSVVRKACFHFFFCQAHLDRTGAGQDS